MLYNFSDAFSVCVSVNMIISFVKSNFCISQSEILLVRPPMFQQIIFILLCLFIIPIFWLPYL